MGKQHTRDITPDRQIQDLLANPQNYLNTDLGLPPEIKATLLRRGRAGIQSSLDEGRSNLSEKLAGSSQGGTPVDAIIRGNVGLQNNANANLVGLEEDVAMKDYEANLNEKDRLMDLYKTRLSGLFGQQQFGSEDEARNDEFNFGDAFEGLLGAGGSIGGGAISRKGRKTSTTTG